jgi:hypothetical protein
MQRLTLKNNFVVNVQSDEQIILWNHVQNLIPYTRITPLFYSGAIAGSEFETYAATKLYIALEIEFTGYGTYYDPAGNIPAVTFYDENDLEAKCHSNVSLAYGVAYSVWPNDIILKNQYFGRVEAGTGLSFMKFNGYRLNV